MGSTREGASDSTRVSNSLRPSLPTRVLCQRNAWLWVALPRIPQQVFASHLFRNGLGLWPRREPPNPGRRRSGVAGVPVGIERPRPCAIMRVAEGRNVSWISYCPQ